MTKTNEDMVERVGEALQKECTAHIRLRLSDDDAWRLARAAMDAMREPTKGMIKAGASNGTPDLLYREEYAVGHWQSMIDEALKSKLD